MGGRFDRPRHSRREPGIHTTEQQAIYIKGDLEFEVGGGGCDSLQAPVPTSSSLRAPRTVSEPCRREVRCIELSTHDRFEGFIETTDQPDKSKILTEAQSKYGVTWHVERIPVLMKRHGVKTTSSMELPPWLDISDTDPSTIGLPGRIHATHSAEGLASDSLLRTVLEQVARYAEEGKSGSIR